MHKTSRDGALDGVFCIACGACEGWKYRHLHTSYGQKHGKNVPFLEELEIAHDLMELN